jgi:hypothetical protein
MGRLREPVIAGLNSVYVFWFYSSDASSSSSSSEGYHAYGALVSRRVNFPIPRAGEVTCLAVQAR